MIQYGRVPMLCCALAGMAMAATPAQARLPAASATLASPAQPVWSANAVNGENYRRHRDYRPYHRRNRVDSGEIIAGILILGGIAAIASAVSEDQDDGYRDRDYRYRDRDRRGERRERDRYEARGSSGGLDNAARQCVASIERDARVEQVESVNRYASGWIVSGQLFNGKTFICRIGNDGRIEGIEYTAEGVTMRDDVRSTVPDRQWSDDRYADAWRDAEAQTDSDDDYADDRMPAYPGGPLPGEDYDRD